MYMWVWVEVTRQSGYIISRVAAYVKCEIVSVCVCMCGWRQYACVCVCVLCVRVCSLCVCVGVSM
jgi:hypothetical protein